MNLVATAAFGLEAVVKRELEHMGIHSMDTENGRIHFEGDVAAMIKANLYLRSADRVYAKIASAKAIDTFDALFDWVTTLPLIDYLDKKGKFIVDAKSVKSKLYSLRDLQSITKKALIENLKQATSETIFKEDGPRHHLTISLYDDEATLLLDTSGAGLHKRGYREGQGKAPLKETLAAALVQLSYYTKERVLYDPFCGSGTIAIEAAMIARNIAPGLNRHFDFEHFHWVESAQYKTLRKEAYKAIDMETDVKIIASDADFSVLEVAKENAANAGVEGDIHFEVARFEHRTFDVPYAVIITNPPYGERMQDEKIHKLYADIGKTIKHHKTCSFYILSGLMGAEKAIGKRAKKTRVLFNGDIKTRYYMYPGPPPKHV
ncbi:MAG: THUMP domain-containing class I SAM-dependent RNA methyltransferase [Bacillota bacterium]